MPCWVGRWPRSWHSTSSPKKYHCVPRSTKKYQDVPNSSKKYHYMQARRPRLSQNTFLCGETPQALAQHRLSQNNPRPCQLTYQHPHNFLWKVSSHVIHAEGGWSSVRAAIYFQVGPSLGWTPEESSPWKMWKQPKHGFDQEPCDLPKWPSATLSSSLSTSAFSLWCLQHPAYKRKYGFYQQHHQQNWLKWPKSTTLYKFVSHICNSDM